MTDEDGQLPGFSITEFDANLSSLPQDLAGYLAVCLKEAVSAGGVVAWCAFEGSFHFDHLLTGDIAPQIYAIADASGVELAIDDEALVSPSWRDRIARARAALR